MYIPGLYRKNLTPLPTFIGSTQHLKNKYGEGYHITIRVGGVTPSIEPLFAAMDHHFHSSAMLLESSSNMAQYHISSDTQVILCSPLSAYVHCVLGRS